jgi:enoyl-CoA hydratase/carnithine racemase
MDPRLRHAGIRHATLRAAMDLSRLAPLHPTHDAALGLLTLDLDHGKANEMGTAQLEAFEALCELLESESAVRTLVTTSHRVTNSGKAIFIAGANVTEREGWDDTKVKAHVLRQRNLMRRLSRLPVFHVVVVNGVTLGWGTEYLLVADYVIAAPEATFALPETGLGILPGARGTAELALRIGPAQALRLGITGEIIDAEEATRVGLANELASDLDSGLARANRLAGAVAKRSPTAVIAYKDALLASLGRPEDERLALERAAYEHCVDTGEAARGRAAFAAIRAGESPAWGARTRHRD